MGGDCCGCEEGAGDCSGCSGVDVVNKTGRVGQCLHNVLENGQGISLCTAEGLFLLFSSFQCRARNKVAHIRLFSLRCICRIPVLRSADVMIIQYNLCSVNLRH